MSMNGQKKFRDAFGADPCQRCCKVGRYKHKYLRDNWPKIRKAPEPSNLLWKNLSINAFTRRCRSLIVWIFGILIVLASLAAIFFSTRYRKDFEDQFTIVDCFNFEVSQEQAYTDYIKDNSTRSGHLNCYCFDQFRSLKFDVRNIEYDMNGELEKPV